MNAADLYVTPCMGVWIETALHKYLYKMGQVTPCMGVWIETGLRRKAVRG